MKKTLPVSLKVICQLSTVDVTIWSRGRIYFSRDLVSNVQCYMDLKKFPHDIQECEMRFESYMHDIKLLNFTSTALCRSQSYDNFMFDLKSTSFELSSIFHELSSSSFESHTVSGRHYFPNILVKIVLKKN